jgi:hypothetical protein
MGDGSICVIGWIWRGSMGDEKNRLGEKLAAAGMAATNQWAARRDRALLAKLQREMEERVAKNRKERRKPRAFNQILCPIDFGPSSLKSLALAKQIASENDAALYVIHVCPAILIPLGGTATTPPPRSRLLKTDSRK